MNTLTVAVFFYKHVDFVCDAIEAISNLLKICPNINIILVDDNSSDATQLSIKFEVESRQIPAKLMLNNVNIGLRANLHRVMKEINTEFVYFIGGDDIINPSGLMSALGEISCSKKLDALICNSKYFGELDGLVHGRAWPYKLINNRPSHFLSFLESYYPRPLLIQATLFRTSTLLQINSFSWNSQLDDWPLFLCLFRHGRIIKYNSDILVSFYRIHGESTAASSERILNLVEQVSNEFSICHKYYSPMSITIFRRFILNKKVEFSADWIIRILYGLFMEVYYKCRTTYLD